MMHRQEKGPGHLLFVIELHEPVNGDVQPVYDVA